MADPGHSMEMGARFPYDGGEAFWSERSPTPRPATDWAHKAARGVLADLDDRGGIKHQLDEVDHETRADIVDCIAAIIRLASEQK